MNLLIIRKSTFEMRIYLRNKCELIYCPNSVPFITDMHIFGSAKLIYIFGNNFVIKQNVKLMKTKNEILKIEIMKKRNNTKICRNTKINLRNQIKMIKNKSDKNLKINQIKMIKNKSDKNLKMNLRNQTVSSTFMQNKSSNNSIFLFSSKNYDKNSKINQIKMIKNKSDKNLKMNLRNQTVSSTITQNKSPTNSIILFSSENYDKNQEIKTHRNLRNSFVHNTKFKKIKYSKSYEFISIKPNTANFKSSKFFKSNIFMGLSLIHKKHNISGIQNMKSSNRVILCSAEKNNNCKNRSYKSLLQLNTPLKKQLKDNFYKETRFCISTNTNPSFIEECEDLCNYQTKNYLNSLSAQNHELYKSNYLKYNKKNKIYSKQNYENSQKNSRKYENQSKYYQSKNQNDIYTRLIELQGFDSILANKSKLSNICSYYKRCFCKRESKNDKNFNLLDIFNKKENESNSGLNKDTLFDKSISNNSTSSFILSKSNTRHRSFLNSDMRCSLVSSSYCINNTDTLKISRKTQKDNKNSILKEFKLYQEENKYIFHERTEIKMQKYLKKYDILRFEHDRHFSAVKNNNSVHKKPKNEKKLANLFDFRYVESFCNDDYHIKQVSCTENPRKFNISLNLGSRESNLMKLTKMGSQNNLKKSQHSKKLFKINIKYIQKILKKALPSVFDEKTIRKINNRILLGKHFYFIYTAAISILGKKSAEKYNLKKRLYVYENHNEDSFTGSYKSEEKCKKISKGYSELKSNAFGNLSVIKTISEDKAFIKTSKSCSEFKTISFGNLSDIDSIHNPKCLKISKGCSEFKTNSFGTLSVIKTISEDKTFLKISNGCSELKNLLVIKTISEDKTFINSSDNLAAKNSVISASFYKLVMNSLCNPLDRENTQNKIETQKNQSFLMKNCSNGHSINKNISKNKPFRIKNESSSSGSFIDDTSIT